MNGHFTLFGQDDTMLFIRDDAADAKAVHEQYALSATFPNDPNKRILPGMRIGYTDDTGVFQVYEVRKQKTILPDDEQDIDADALPMAELAGERTEALTITAETAASALTALLGGTLWDVGSVVSTSTATVDLSYMDKWAALVAIRDAYNVRLGFRVTVTGNAITGRYVDLLTNVPTFRGIRLTLDRNVQRADVAYDDYGLYTAMYGYGQTNTAEDGTVTRVTFADTVWATPDDPADKPTGQTWIEDATAKAAYGRNGRNRFGVYENYEITDPGELLEATWEALQKANAPKFVCNATVHNLFAYGYAGEQILLGDEVQVVLEPAGVRVAATVVKLIEDLLEPENTKPTIGNYGDNILYSMAGMASASNAGAAIAKANPDLLRGVLDTMVTKILSTGTKRYTDTDGSEIYEAADGTKAVKFTGSGILLASTKTSGAWVWRTAITGSGIAADEVTTGTLRAALVTILGSENFYISGPTLYIKDPADANKQIRIGLYDGTNYGVALTTNGGTTWSQAITFDGVKATEVNAANWKFNSSGATYTENGTVLFQILMDAAQGASVSAALTKRLFLMGREMYFFNTATSGAVILGKDDDAGYAQQCFYPVSTRTGNLGTPSHIWDTASIRAVFRESEGGLSSRKIKKRIRKLKSASAIIDALQPVTFIYRDDPKGKEHYGLVYEDTEAVAPLLCVQLKDGDANPRNFGIDYSSMTVLLLKELQELRKRVKALEEAQ